MYKIYDDDIIHFRRYGALLSLADKKPFKYKKYPISDIDAIEAEVEKVQISLKVDGLMYQINSDMHIIYDERNQREQEIKKIFDLVKIPRFDAYSIFLEMVISESKLISLECEPIKKEFEKIYSSKRAFLSGVMNSKYISSPDVDKMINNCLDLAVANREKFDHVVLHIGRYIFLNLLRYKGCIINCLLELAPIVKNIFNFISYLNKYMNPTMFIFAIKEQIKSDVSFSEIKIKRNINDHKNIVPYYNGQIKKHYIEQWSETTAHQHGIEQDGIVAYKTIQGMSGILVYYKTFEHMTATPSKITWVSKSNSQNKVPIVHFQECATGKLNKEIYKMGGGSLMTIFRNDIRIGKPFVFIYKDSPSFVDSEYKSIEEEDQDKINKYVQGLVLQDSFKCGSCEWPLTYKVINSNYQAICKNRNCPGVMLSNIQHIVSIVLGTKNKTISKTVYLEVAKKVTKYESAKPHFNRLLSFLLLFEVLQPDRFGIYNIIFNLKNDLTTNELEHLKKLIKNSQRISYKFYFWLMVSAVSYPTALKQNRPTDWTECTMMQAGDRLKTTQAHILLNHSATKEALKELYKYLNCITVN